MEIGFVGLGRMGARMALNAAEKGIGVAAYNRTPEEAETLARQNRKIRAASSLEELCKSLRKPRKIWLMVPAGKPVDDVVDGLSPHLHEGDVVVDGGNSFYEDSIRRHRELKKKGIFFVDVGTSGGLEGARHGASLTIGGDREAFKRLEPLFKVLSAKGGYAYVGGSGAGHFVKMVHNAIEYAMLEAYGEGLEMLARGPCKKLNLRKIAGAWNNGGVIRSWLLELLEKALAKDARLEGIAGTVGGGETGEWAAKTAKKSGVKMPAVELAVRRRKQLKQAESFSGRVIAALRREFGGHEAERIRKP